MTLPYLPPPEPWMADAHRDNGRGGSYPAAAYQACRLCPVQHECAEYAIINDEPAGLWGGLTPRRRRQIRRERGMT